MSDYFSDSYLNSIAIIGMSCRFPGADDYEKFWQSIADGIESISALTDDQLSTAGADSELLKRANYVKFASLLKEAGLFDAEFFGLTAREATITAPAQRWSLACAYEAIEDAGYSLDSINRNVGVFLGVNRCDEWQKRLYGLAEDGAGEFARQLQLYIANDLDYAATRISYKFNLKGPSFNVSTACSTSLVAVHQACRSLLSYESDMALAGGSNIVVSLDQGYLYEPGGIQSDDGHCRAFDAASTGTIFGNGVGIVLLKRLEDALNDGDHIHAIIRATAINNDGSAKVGYTAPSITGQSEVISTALALAEVEPETIRYVEAHGTGTKLGDPIEIEALSKAYKTSTTKKQYCAISSVKTNIGHLGAAAGVAGLIKAVQALRHREIPPSLHFQQPNREIDFASTPFYVAAKKEQWRDAIAPRRAAVSSFGVGGTNAHAILEEAPPRALSRSHRKLHLLTLSARTPNALARLSSKLAKHLEINVLDSNSGDFADVAYTANIGRRAFPYRHSLVARDAADAIVQLRSSEYQEQQVPALSEAPQVVFMFPGQGAQYTNMTLGLYRSEPQYTQVVNECVDIVRSLTGNNILDILFTASDASMETADFSDAINSTEFAQPALFITEYALAKLLQTWGIQPAALIGHSIGEYVAACLAGVFSLRDALKIVVARGRLMASMPTGTMLAVSLSEEKLLSRIGACDIAGVNGPDWCVAAGTTADITSLQEQLENEKIVCRRLPTSHAFHSRMMEPIIDEFTALFKEVALSEPKIPFISNLTGTWIAANEAVSPAYWAAHLRNTVRFYTGAKSIVEGNQAVLIEVGPGKTLSSLVSSFLPNDHRHTLISLCRQPKQPYDDLAFLLESIGKLWTAGVSPDFAAFYQGSSLHRVPLPTYPFEYQKFWLEKFNYESRSVELSEAGTFNTPADNSVQKKSNTSTKRPTLVKLLAEQHSSDRLEATRALLSHLCCSIFGVATVVHDIPLIELGMSSLMAIELRTKLNAAVGYDCVAVVDLLDESATIDNLSAQLLQTLMSRVSEQEPDVTEENIQAACSDGVMSTADVMQPATMTEEESGGSDQQVLLPEPDSTYLPFPLTDIQQAYWVGRNSTFAGAGVATYAYLEIELRDIDIERYETALNRVIQRHHMLRMVVQPDGQQRFLEQVPHYRIAVEDLTANSESQREKVLAELRAKMSHQILDTSVWPLFEVKATRLPEDKYRLHYGFDFMIVDVLSLLVFFRDLFLFYADESARLRPLEITFRDYVNFEIRGKSDGTYLRAKQYWLARLNDLPAAPQLPQTMPVDQIIRPRYKRRDFTLDVATWSNLKQTARRHKLTPSVLIANAFSEVLVQWCQSPRFTLNLTIFNRPKVHEQVNDLIGDFTSSVLLEVDMSQRSTFVDGAKRLQKRLMTDLEHRQFNGVEVLRALNNQHGSYQSVLMPIVLTSALGLDQYSEAKLAGIAPEKLKLYHEMMDLGHTISQTSQVWLDHVVREKDGILFCNWDTLEELFPDGVLDDMFCAYYDRLNQLANEGEQAWASPAPVELPMEQNIRRQNVNSADAPISESLLHELFEQSAKVHSTKIAIYDRNHEISYRDLRSMARRIAQQLAAAPNCPSPGKLVGILMDKGWEQIVAVYGTLYSGAAYMPIDAGLPAARILELIQQGQVDIVITQSHVLDRVTLPADIHTLPVTDADRIFAQNNSEELPLPSVSQSARDLAYVLFTSGSTGVPKGVMVSHQSAVNTVLDVNEKFKVAATDKAIFINALNFDLSVYDIFGLLSCGGALVIPDYTRQHDAVHWLDLVAKYQVTVWNTVPAIVQLFMDEVIENSAAARTASLRYFMMSGDWIPTELPRRIFNTLPWVQPVSLGGPTETTVWSIFHVIAKEDCDKKSIPYGKPLANRLHRILHKDLSDCPEWVVGEIYTGGRIGLAEGYWNDADKTNASFIHHPTSGERLYRTGDLGRFLPDGNIEFVGRVDNQIKIQGHRIELGEIEYTLKQCEGVKDAVVVAAPANIDSPAKKMRLVAFVEATDQEETEPHFHPTPGMLMDPMSIAVFKMEQHGLRRLGENFSRVRLPGKPDSNTSLTLIEKSLSARYQTASSTVRERAELSLDEMGKWLSCLGQVALEGYSLPKYFYPSAGSAHPIQVYLDVGRHSIRSVDPGTYYYDPADHTLVQLTPSEEYPRLSYAKQNEISLYLISYDPAITKIYGATGCDRFSPIEAGHMENLLLSASSTISLTPRKSSIGRDIASSLPLGQEYRILKSYSVCRTSPKNRAESGGVALKLLERQSFREFKGGLLEFEAMSQLLESWRLPAAGVTDKKQPKVYLYVKRNRIAGLAGGFYGFDVATGELKLIKAISQAEFVPSLQFGRNLSIHRHSAFTILLVADTNSDGIDTELLVTTGYLAQAAQNICTKLGIGLCTTAGAKMDVVNRYVPLEDGSEILYCIEGGALSSEQIRTWTTEAMHAQEKGGDLEIQWKDYLKEKLPYYMVPTKIFALEKFPLTRNGKVDRKQLLALDAEQLTTESPKQQLVQPRNVMEKAVADIWRKVLQVSEFGVHDSLFELGGDSISATKMISEVHKTLGISVPLHKIFADPTVAGMARECQSALQLNGADVQAEFENRERISSQAEITRDGLTHLTETLKRDAVLDMKRSFSDMRTGKFAEPKVVLLTGGTGFLGAYVLAELLEQTEADIYCLSRSNASGNAAQRIRTNLIEKDLWKSSYLDRIIAIEGDLAQDNFGLSVETYDYLCANVDVIYHVGALVNYARSYADMKAVNVGGMRSIIALASTYVLKSVVMISTKYVCFSMHDAGIKIHKMESAIDDPTGLFVGYTQSKWVAEQLASQAQDLGVPVTIIRPGQITGAANGKLSLPKDAFHQLLALFYQLNVFPERGTWQDGVLDVVPVDIAARAIVNIGTHTEAQNDYYHLVNSSSLKIDEFFDVLRSFLDVSKRGNLHDSHGSLVQSEAGKYQIVSFETWADECLRYIRQMEDAPTAFVLEKFFADTAHGRLIKGLFLDPQFTLKDQAAYLNNSDIRQLLEHAELWSRYLDGVANEASKSILQKLAVV